MSESIGEIVRKMEQLDKQGNTVISKYVNFNLRETLEKIDAYVNSKHTSGPTDSKGREKPFFNIVTAAINIWYRATDIDRKHIKVKATKKSHYIISFLATILLQEWMRKSSFGIFLNNWGRTLAKYGSAVSKFVEKDGKLYSEIIPWNRLICDPIDFANNIKIEKLDFTPSQLRSKKEFDQELVEKLLTNLSSRKLISGEIVDNKSEYITVYEVHGELPLSLISKKEDDDDIFVQQMHIFTYLEKKDGKFDDYDLANGQESKDPYYISHLIKEDGRTLAIGAVENLFESQWVVNHSQKQIKDQLDLASKMLFQTSDGNFVGQNAMTNIENGDILIHTQNQPITQLNNKPDIAAMQSFGQQWQAVGNQINGISEAMMGENQPSGSAWRQTEALLQESHSLFELMTENKSLDLEEMLIKYVIPYLKKQLDTTEEISAILEEHQIKQIDSMYIPNEAIRITNKKIKDTILSGEAFDTSQQSAEIIANEEMLKKELSTLGNQRFIKPSEISTTTWKEIIKDLEWDLEVDIAGEQKDTRSIMATLSTVFQTVASLKGQPMSDDMKLVFNKILEMSSSVSPIELSSIKPQQMAKPMPEMAMVGRSPNQLTQ